MYWFKMTITAFRIEQKKQMRINKFLLACGIIDHNEYNVRKAYLNTIWIMIQFAYIILLLNTPKK